MDLSLPVSSRNDDAPYAAHYDSWTIFTVSDTRECDIQNFMEMISMSSQGLVHQIPRARPGCGAVGPGPAVCPGCLPREQNRQQGFQGRFFSAKIVHFFIPDV